MKNTIMRSFYLTVLLFMFGIVFFAVSTMAANYYVDATAGSDSNNGTSTASPWKTLTKVNSMTFQPGDTIFLKKGEAWTGRLWPKGSGSQGAPITIDAYGTGNAPHINGNGQESAVYLYNQQYWEIKNLEITNNNGTSSRRLGIYVVNEDAGTLEHIHIVGNNVHDVYGDNVKDGNGSGGIKIRTIAGNVKSNYNGILIDGNVVGPRVDRTGIDVNSDYWCRPDSGCTGTYNWYPSTDVMIQNNYVADVGGDGIVPMATLGAIVQYNTVNGFNMRSGTPNAGIWAWNADHTVIQYNEAFNGHTTRDGQGFDIDYGQTGTIVQYNYSHDNDGGFILICQPGGAKNDGGIVRYNISQNDYERVFHLIGPTTNTQVYNNTIYLPAGSTTQPINVGSWGGYTQSISFYNNIWHLDGAGSWLGIANAGTFNFNYNTIYGVHTAGEPADPNKLTANPWLAGPGTGTNRTAVDGYKLLTGSPAIGTGMLVSNNGGKDYWGNTVSSSAAPNRGAYNGSGVQGTPPSPLIVHNGGFETGALGPWGNWNTASVVAGNARSGSYALQLAGGPGSSEQVVQVQPNTTYTLSGYARTTNSSEQVRIGVKNYGGTETYAVITSTSYTKGTVTFTTGASHTTATIYVYKPSGAAYAYGDDLSIATTASISNSGFESGTLSPWTNWNTASVAANNARSGSYALRLAGGPGSAEQVIPLQPSTTYTLSGYAKTATASQPVRIGVKNYGGAEVYAVISSTSYTQGSVTFTTGSSNTTATIYVFKPSGSSDAYSDDLTITQ
ncbi:carbohydrate binding domain-containing protein [Paenibacillus chungangensis]|uniref:Carbohydrate binding domain-containing protein n=1 Tax=Paenibacillus chungangensis TaxID=696535 RepID=A0ABW3HRQ7_9BACL